jgi:hypothetical protein
MEDMGEVQVVVGGHSFIVPRHVLAREATSVLADVATSGVGERAQVRAIHITRNAGLFAAMLAVLMHGAEQLPADVALLHQLYTESAHYRLVSVRDAIEQRLAAMMDAAAVAAPPAAVAAPPAAVAAPPAAVAPGPPPVAPVTTHAAGTSEPLPGAGSELEAWQPMLTHVEYMTGRWRDRYATGAGGTTELPGEQPSIAARTALATALPDPFRIGSRW